jgi:hypothetical protein
MIENLNLRLMIDIGIEIIECRFSEKISEDNERIQEMYERVDLIHLFMSSSGLDWTQGLAELKK